MGKDFEQCRQCFLEADEDFKRLVCVLSWNDSGYKTLHTQQIAAVNRKIEAYRDKLTKMRWGLANRRCLKDPKLNDASRQLAIESIKKEPPNLWELL